MAKPRAFVREVIERKILLIRGHKGLLSIDLARLYEVEHKVLMQAVRRNRERFPDDFMFQLNPEEFAILKSQFVTSKLGRDQETPVRFYRTGSQDFNDLYSPEVYPISG